MILSINNETPDDSPNHETESSDLPPCRLSIAMQFIQSFGRINGSIWFADGLSFSEAMERHIEFQKATYEKLKAENRRLRVQLIVAKRMTGTE